MAILKRILQRSAGSRGGFSSKQPLRAHSPPLAGAGFFTNTCHTETSRKQHKQPVSRAAQPLSPPPAAQSPPAPCEEPWPCPVSCQCAALVPSRDALLTGGTSGTPATGRVAVSLIQCTAWGSKHFPWCYSELWSFGVHMGIRLQQQHFQLIPMCRSVATRML